MHLHTPLCFTPLSHLSHYLPLPILSPYRYLFLLFLSFSFSSISCFTLQTYNFFHSFLLSSLFFVRTLSLSFILFKTLYSLFSFHSPYHLLLPSFLFTLPIICFFLLFFSLSLSSASSFFSFHSPYHLLLPSFLFTLPIICFFLLFFSLSLSSSSFFSFHSPYHLLLPSFLFYSFHLLSFVFILFFIRNFPMEKKNYTVANFHWSILLKSITHNSPRYGQY
ncbi:unnamed protein product [Acanthosepion pharaonis]|uniref:Uncharacterized protein n=1 Tax=Acanthosepion pharaonis TaxID=158019 RepID=A0A812BW73_ACAPH|nr:unnamed protein product [Sepia pharaonis]